MAFVLGLILYIALSKDGLAAVVLLGCRHFFFLRGLSGLCLIGFAIRNFLQAIFLFFRFTLFVLAHWLCFEIVEPGG